jgi:Secretion system C-terminal sorting domain
MKTMKTIVLYIATICLFTKSKAQNFTENFDTATINSLNSNCWVLNGVSTSTQNGEAISGTSIYTLPPTNPGTKIDLYAPILNFASANTTIGFDYRLTQVLNGNATRSIQVSLVNLSGFIVKSDTITMGAGTNTAVKQYQHTFNPIVAGNYRVAIRITGAYGNGNVRLVIDNFDVSNASLYNNGSAGCVLVPIVDITLPVQLASFTATLNNNNIADLKWVTVSEINVSHFVIEKSTDGQNFSDAGMIFAYGNATDKTNYSFSDNVSSVQSGVIYYRIRSVDQDGKSQYSETRIIRISKTTDSNIAIEAYPNPVINELRVSIPSSWQNKKVVYELFSANGQTAQKVETASSNQTETLNVNNLAPGLYIVRASCNGETAQQKIIKK